MESRELPERPYTQLLYYKVALITIARGHRNHEWAFTQTGSQGHKSAPVDHITSVARVSWDGGGSFLLLTSLSPAVSQLLQGGQLGVFSCVSVFTRYCQMHGQDHENKFTIYIDYEITHILTTIYVH